MPCPRPSRRSQPPIRATKMLVAGTDVGLVKIFQAQDTSSKRKREETVKNVGNIDREREIQLVTSCKFTANDESLDGFVVARKDGSVELCNMDGQIIKSWIVEEAFRPKAKTEGVKGAVWASSNKFVGLDYRNDTLITCTGTGIVRYTGSELRTYKTLANPPANSGINAMKVHPENMHIFATGGEEYDLQVWHVLQECLSIWKAKNLPNDNLDLRVPVWVTSLQWIGPERIPLFPQKQRGSLEKLLQGQACQIAVGTGYGQVRFYDVCGEQKRPLLNQVVTGQSKPVRSLAIGMYQSRHVAIVGDTVGLTSIVDLSNGKTLASLHPTAAGSITSIVVCPASDSPNRFVATGSIDRFVRVYDLEDEKRKMVAKIYLKQRASGLAACGLISPDQDLPSEGQYEEDVWESIPLVKKKKHNQ